MTKLQEANLTHAEAEAKTAQALFDKASVTLTKKESSYDYARKQLETAKGELSKAAQKRDETRSRFFAVVDDILPVYSDRISILDTIRIPLRNGGCIGRNF